MDPMLVDSETKPENMELDKNFNKTARSERLTPTQIYVNKNINMKLPGGDHTPSTCYGNIQFEKGTTSKFIRCADDTDHEKLFYLFTEHWKVEKPRLLLSFAGGGTSDLPPWLKKDFQEGLLKVTKALSAWILSGGVDTGAMRILGEANRADEFISIGIVAWGITAKRDTLVPTGFESNDRRSGDTFPYRLGSHLVGAGEAFLNYNHTHFIMVDNGTEGRYGVEIPFRGKFTEYLIQHKTGGIMIPSVLVLLGGGPGSLNSVFYEAVQRSRPCVIVEGSGRAADILAYACNYADQILELEEDGKQHDGLVDEIMRMFNFYGPNDMEKVKNLKDIIVKCIKKKDLFSIANIRKGMGTADAIITALLKDKTSAPSQYEQMQLAILWDRVNLAETKIMSTLWVPKEVNGRPPPYVNHTQRNAFYRDLKLEEKRAFKDQEAAATQHELNKLMIMALAMNKISFVNFLQGYGVSIKSFLTKQIMQYLYAYRRNLGLSKLKYELQTDNMENQESRYAPFFKNLQEYTDIERGQDSKAEIQEIKLEEIKKLFCSLLGRIPKSIIQQIIEVPEHEGDFFRSPLTQLFIWAVFNNMLDMALLLWEFEEDAICKALIAAELTHGLIQKIRQRDQQDEVEKSLVFSFNTYRKLSLDLLDYCYKTHEKDTELLVTMRLGLLNEDFSCLDFAVASDHRDFVSHDCVQGILNDVWTGSITQRYCGGFKICAFIFCPFLLFNSKEIRTRRELKKMIQCADLDENEDEGTKHLANFDDFDYLFDGGGLGVDLVDRLINKMDSAKKEKEKIFWRKQLPFIKKLYYFHVYSPVVRFYMHTIGYLLFLMLFAYVAMVKKVDNVPTGLEILLIITVVGYAVSEIHQLLCIDASSAGLKFKGYIDNIWNQFDIACLLVFIIAVILRCIPSTVEYGHLFYAFDVSLWIIRLMHILYVNPVAGPYVVMIGHMFVDLINFVLILVIFLLAYGIAVKGILDPTPDNAQMFVASIFKPYFHWHGEYFLDSPEDANTTYFGTEKRNSYAEPIALIYMAVYLLIVNILLLNLVIAIFNSTYERIMADATRVWRFQRYGLIMEYARRSVFYPPFSLFFHLYLLIRWLFSLCSCTRVKPHTMKSGLKTQERIEKQKKNELRELENNCLIKLMRIDDSASGSTGLESRMTEMENKMETKMTEMENKEESRMIEMEKRIVEKLELLQRKETKDDEIEKIKESVDEALTSQFDELETLKKLRMQNAIEKEKSAEIEAKLEEENRALKEEVQKLQIDIKNYLQDIEEKTTLMKKKDREIEELKEEHKESLEASGLEN